jgi:hypothetical protein
MLQKSRKGRRKRVTLGLLHTDDMVQAISSSGTQGRNQIT